MTIIEWKDAAHITIQFENGEIVETDSKGFYHNGIQSPTYKKQQYQHRVGETNINTMGQQMRIIAYNNSTDITVEFETGEIREHAAYASFCDGTLRPTPRRAKYTAEEVLNQTNTAKTGQKMTVTGFRRSYDIDVTFEDGAVVYGVCYADFLRGTIKHPSSSRPTARTAKTEKEKQERINRTYITKEGYTVSIVEYINSNCITIRFEDGVEKEGVKYRDLVAGNVMKPISHLHEIYYNTDGERMEIIEYIDAHHITIQFENGDIKKDCQYHSIKKGYIKHRPTRLGEIHYNRQGERMRIVEYVNHYDATVEFDDGTRREHLIYQTIKRGTVPKKQRAG